MTHDHQTCVKVCAAAARILLQIDLETAIEKALRELVVRPPCLDPSEWRANHEKLVQDVAFLRAALPLWQKARELATEQPLSITFTKADPEKPFIDLGTRIAEVEDGSSDGDPRRRSKAPRATCLMHVVFDRDLRFVEIETPDGRSQRCGEWTSAKTLEISTTSGTLTLWFAGDPNERRLANPNHAGEYGEWVDRDGLRVLVIELELTPRATCLVHGEEIPCSICHEK